MWAAPGRLTEHAPAAPLAYLRAGQGARPLVLLHGFLGAARNLATLARQLAERAPAYSVFALDLTGHGASPPLPPGADLATLAGDVLGTARALGLATPLPIVGHSLGGRVALRAGLLEPAGVARVTLLDITPSPVVERDGETTRLVEALASAPATAPSRDVFRVHLRRRGVPDDIVEWLLLNVTREGASYRWRIDRVALAELSLRTNTEDLWPAVEGPRSYEVACIRGSRSRYVSDADVRRLEAAGCSVEALEGAGHFVHIDRPGELLARLLAGLPDTAGREGA